MTTPATAAEEPALRISWSRLRTHAECQMHSALLREGRRATAADVRGFFPGTVVDRAMRRYLDTGDPQPGQMVSWVEEIVSAEETTARETGDGIVRWKHPKDKAEVITRCQAAAAKLEKILAVEVLPYDYQPAVRFSSPIKLPGPDGALVLCSLIGEMDLLVRKPGGVYNVWDLKITADGGYWRKVTGQLLFYDVAVKLGWNAWPASSGLLQPECAQPVLRFAFTAEHRRQLLLRVAKYAEDVWNDKRAMTPKASECRFCDCKHACPRWAKPARGRVELGGST